MKRSNSDLVDRVKPEDSVATRLTPAIETHGLGKDYVLGLRGVRVRALDNLTLTVMPNQVFGLLGPNGSGKSTSLKIILGLIRPTSGSARIFGRPSTHPEARRKVGFLPESPSFYPFLTGWEMVRFFARLSGVRSNELDERTERAISDVGLLDAAGRRLGLYSKGMLQRIGLAQALVHDPDLLILDEPMAGVDPFGTEAFIRIIQELKSRGKTVLLCTHLLSQAEQICDEIAILHLGRLVLEGSMANILRNFDRRSLVVGSINDKGLKAVRDLLSSLDVELHSIDFPPLGLEAIFRREVIKLDSDSA